MNVSLKKMQIFLCIIAAVGLFLPLLTMSMYGDSGSISFFDFDNGKILLGLLVLLLITLALQFKYNNIIIKIISIVFVVASGVFFLIDASKMSSVKKYLTVIKYGIGYYMTLIGLIMSFLTGILDLFSHNESSSDDINFVVNNDYSESKGNVHNDYSPVNDASIPNVDNSQVNTVNNISNPSMDNSQANTVNNTGILNMDNSQVNMVNNTGNPYVDNNQVNNTTISNITNNQQ